MKTFKGTSATFEYNDDNGIVKIVEEDISFEVEIKMQDILDFAAQYVKEKKIENLLQMETNEILGL